MFGFRKGHTHFFQKSLKPIKTEGLTECTNALASIIIFATSFSHMSQKEVKRTGLMRPRNIRQEKISNREDVTRILSYVISFISIKTYTKFVHLTCQ